MLHRLIPLFLLACSSDIPREGSAPGDCSDRADNDSNGLFDCEDPGCSASTDCDTGATGTTTATTLPGPPCSLPGTYVLVGIDCGVADLANAPTNFFDHYSEIAFTTTDAGRGECATTLTLTGPTCVAEETLTLRGSPELGVVDMRSDGVVDCMPSGCGFVNGTQACTEGAGASESFASYYAVDLGNDQFEIHGWGDQLYPCDLGIKTTWQKQD